MYKCISMRRVRQGSATSTDTAVGDDGQDYRVHGVRPPRPRLQAGGRARQALERVRRAAAGRRGEDPGRALHGLRHPLLSQRLPGQQPDPGLERPRLSRPLGDGGAQPALDQQLPRDHRPRMPGAVRGLLHAQHRRQAGHHQDHRVRHRRQGLRGRLDRAATSPRARPARRSPSSARDLPGWPPRSSWRAPATTCTSTRRAPSPAGCWSTASPTSRWKSTSSSGA